MKTTRALLFALAASLLATPVYAQFQVGGSSGAGAGVNSFNGRTGTVTPQSGDYTAAQVGAAPQTSGTSILKGNGTGGTTSAVSGTDYAPATSGTSVLKGDGAGGTTAAVAGTDYGTASGPGSSTNGNFPSFNGTSGKSLLDSGYNPSSFAPAGVVTVVTGSNPTTNAAAWSAFTQYTIGGSGRTITIPASSGLSANGGLFIDANTNSVTLQANAADTITFAGATTGAGGSVSLPAGAVYSVTTDAAGKLYVSGRGVQGNGTKTQLSTGTTTANNCVKFDANGNTVDAGATCGGAYVPPALPSYVANNWYLPYPYTGLATPGALGNTTTVFMPFMVQKTLTITALGVKVVTGSAGQNIRMGIYAADANNLPTGSALVDTGNFSAGSSSNNAQSGAISYQLQANTLYFMAAQVSDGVIVLEGFGITNGSFTGYLTGASNISSIGANGGQIDTTITHASTFGTLPTITAISVAGANGSTLKNFIGMFKVGSIP